LNPQLTTRYQTQYQAQINCIFRHRIGRLVIPKSPNRQAYQFMDPLA